MHNSVKEMLSSLVEDQLTSLIREANCVQRHVKRARFQPPTLDSNASNNDDMSEEMEDIQQKKCFVKRLDAADINLALQWRGCQTLFTTNTGAPFAATSATGTANSGGNNPNSDKNNDQLGGSKSSMNSESHKHARATDRSLQRVNLNTFVRSEMQSRPPSEIAVSLHWLAVDGIQPSIPQNPLLPHSYVSANAAKPYHYGGKHGDDSVMGTGGRIVHRVEEDDEYGIGVSIRQLLPRLLPDELKYYFTNVAMKMASTTSNYSNASTSTTEEEQDEALANLASDRGIQELVPFFSQFVNNQIRYNLKQVEHCRTMIRLMDALISNTHLTLEMHLSQMIVPIITCTVARNLGSHRRENHWALREEAAQTLVKIHNKYGAQYTNLSPQLLEVLCDAIGPDKPITTQYGGIVGLTFFGPKTIDAFLLPIALQYWEKWGSLLEPKTENQDLVDEISRFEIQRCQQALLNALGIYMQHSSKIGHRAELDTQHFEDIFGERWIPLQTYQNCQSDYLLSFL